MTDRVRPSFFGVAMQVMRLPLAGRRNSILLLAVTQRRPVAQAQLPPHCVRQSSQRSAVDHAVGVDAVRSHLQHALRPAGLHFGDVDPVLIGELMGLIDHTGDRLNFF